jgi:hypothetical protein
MPRESRNIGASVRARLLDRARAERSDFQILLTRYALERLLYRLSASPHRDRFVLKGAMLFMRHQMHPGSKNNSQILANPGSMQQSQIKASL